MQPVKRQLEAALAEIEGSSKSGGYDAMRRYLQLVRVHGKGLLHQDDANQECKLRSDRRACLQVRELKIRESENVTLLGCKLLRHYRSKLMVEECKLIVMLFIVQH